MAASAADGDDTASTYDADPADVGRQRPVWRLFAVICHRRHGGFGQPADGAAAGFGASVGHGFHQIGVGCLHRIHPRRAADHHVVHRLFAAELLPAAAQQL